MNISKHNIIRQRPRLLYAGIHNSSEGWLTEKQAAENVEFLLVSKGSGKAEIGDGTYPFTAGDLIICNKGCAHREAFDAVPAREMYFIGVGNLRLYGLEPDTVLKDRDFCLIHTESAFKPLCGYLTQLLAEAESDQPLHEAIADHLLRIILLFAVRLAGYDSEHTFGENVTYTQARRYIDEHFLEIKSIDSVCRSLYINKYYLSHMFSDNAGMPPMRYLIGKRIDLACHYLETTDQNVADIGKACGYPDPCYFSRMFKKVKKVTPLRYRYLFKLEKAGKKEGK